MISNTVKNLIGEDKIKTDLYLIRNLLKILSVLLLIFTTIFFTCFGCFLVMNDTTSQTAQTVTLSSEGVMNEINPEGMGEYQLAERFRNFGIWFDWYRHVDREDRSLMYNSNGNIKFDEVHNLIFYHQIIIGTSPIPMILRM